MNNVNRRSLMNCLIEFVKHKLRSNVRRHCPADEVPPEYVEHNGNAKEPENVGTYG